jgi:hypothetical protein
VSPGHILCSQLSWLTGEPKEVRDLGLSSRNRRTVDKKKIKDVGNHLKTCLPLILHHGNGQ